jgi:acetyltransferase-like isoleucine patch superfamily enzyme
LPDASGDRPRGLARFFRRARKKLAKRIARNAFFPGMRAPLLRWAGYTIGADVYIADGLTIVDELADVGTVSIGDRASLAPNVTIVASSHPNRSRIRAVAPVRSAPVVIEADAWVGAGAVILPGVRIGRGAVVGALALVTADVEPLQIVVGQPARPAGRLPEPPGW